MKRIILLWLLVVTAISSAWAENTNAYYVYNGGNDSVSVNTIVDGVMDHAPYYANVIKEYRADLYVKGRVYVRKSNIFVRFIPAMFRPKKGTKEYLVESYSDLHFTAPNIYDQKVKAVQGTANKFRGVGGDVLDYFHVNIYTPFLLHTKLVSPLTSTGRKHYTYKVDSVFTENEHITYRVKFTPRNKSYQLVEGYMIVSDGVWSVREMQFSGRSEYFIFDNLIKMGKVDTDQEYVPVQYDLNATYLFVGNVIDGSYTAVLNHRSIELNDDEEVFALEDKKKSYDLTDSYTLQTDTARHYTDSVTFNKLRAIPLTDNEQRIYENYYLSADTTLYKGKTRDLNRFWGEVGDMLISDYTIDLAEAGSVKCSPILNPFLVSYNGRDGFSYRQDFRYRRFLPNDRYLRISPRVGYNFKHGEFYWRIRGDYDYWPSKRSSVHLHMGNGNRIYNSEVLEEIKNMPDTIFDFDKIHLDYFRDFNIDIRHRTEIINGLKIDIGISGHSRTAVKKSDFTVVEPTVRGEEEEGIHERFRNRYASYAPRVVVSWTPGQYYYMSGRRKVNLYSKYPTFSVDWERGIEGFLGTTGNHVRIELDLQHRVPLGLMRTLYYRVGCGAFTDQDQIYFVDFENFAKNSLPVGWNDEIGGVFQLLDGRWYNSSRKYLKGHVTYEAPFLLLPRLLKRTRNVLNERLYLGVLTMPHLNPYTEIGYGIGTHIFDLGGFVSIVNGKYEDFRLKFTFELFNR